MTGVLSIVRRIGGQTDPAVGLPSFLAHGSRKPARLGAVLGILLALGAPPQAVWGTEEFRGVWVVRHALTSPERIREVVKTAQAARLNALLVQVRGRGDAYYLSGLVPPAEDLAKVPPTFDPLATVVRQARDAGLEVHAWINVYLTWHPAERIPESPQHVFLRHPEWFMVSSHGIDMGRTDLSGVNLVSRGVEGRYLSPAVPEVRQHILEVVDEILTGYDIDGIHLDYVRYPNHHYDFNRLVRENFAKRFRFDPIALSDGQWTDGERDRKARLDRMRRQWERWRTDQVTLLVDAIRRRIRRLKPWVRLSAAVKPDFVKAYREHGQDWIRWINKRTIDFVVPMFYTGTAVSIRSQIQEAQKYVKKGHLYAGVGVYNQTAVETETQVDVARSLGLKGVVLFSCDSLIGQPEITERLREGPFQQAARIPRMAWKRERYGAKAQAGRTGRPGG